MSEHFHPGLSIDGEYVQPVRCVGALYHCPTGKHVRCDAWNPPKRTKCDDLCFPPGTGLERYYEAVREHGLARAHPNPREEPGD